MLHPHVPEELKHYGKHLFATFLGLLMALGLESCHQGHLHARTAQIAQNFIARELEANRAELKQEIESIRMEGPKILQVIRALEQQAGEVPATAHAELPKDQFALNLATLRSASWEASVATQAFSYMDPWRVEKIAYAFTLHRDLQTVHALLIPKIITLSRLSPVIAGQVPLKKTPPAEVSALLGDLRESLIVINSAYATAKSLDQASAEALQACRP